MHGQYLTAPDPERAPPARALIAPIECRSYRLGGCDRVECMPNGLGDFAGAVPRDCDGQPRHPTDHLDVLIEAVACDVGAGKDLGSFGQRGFPADRRQRPRAALSADAPADKQRRRDTQFSDGRPRDIGDHFTCASAVFAIGAKRVHCDHDQ
ncbi:Uncharacterised protein [Mycobacteroides abscessus subsp. abscessus]|nr:Uncharacterised protein [Mycobacteroides abscessus subsp. abscessus]